MEVIFERLLIELAAFAVQLAIMRFISWLNERSPSAGTRDARAVAA